MGERGDGVIAACAEFADGRKLVVIVSPGPRSPTVAQSRSAVVWLITRLLDEYGDPDLRGDRVPLATLGLVAHRRGVARTTRHGRRWCDALVEGCAAFGIVSLGVRVRTASGAIVRPAGRPDCPMLDDVYVDANGVLVERCETGGGPV